MLSNLLNICVVIHNNILIYGKQEKRKKKNCCTCLVIQCFLQSQDPWRGTQEHHLPPCSSQSRVQNHYSLRTWICYITRHFRTEKNVQFDAGLAYIFCCSIPQEWRIRELYFAHWWESRKLMLN